MVAVFRYFLGSLIHCIVTSSLFIQFPLKCMKHKCIASMECHKTDPCANTTQVKKCSLSSCSPTGSVSLSSLPPSQDYFDHDFCNGAIYLYFEFSVRGSQIITAFIMVIIYDYNVCLLSYSKV